MNQCFFVSDLHGQIHRYEALFSKIKQEKPGALFLGGDLLPSFGARDENDFLNDYLSQEFIALKTRLGLDYPRVFLILGNDDGKSQEEDLVRYMEREKIWEYIHNKSAQFGPYNIFGYAYVPPTPFLNKDWERYDISRYVDPGCIAPEDGWRSVEQPLNIIQHATIQADLNTLIGDTDLSKSILLFHTPPYKTKLDRAALDGKMIDHVPLDVHVGSIAVKDLLLARQPLLTLHGHVHESARLTGFWKEQLGETIALSAAHDGPELALVRFDPDHPLEASRELC
jgi:Icc-related predicted phosphoesterase